MQLSAPIAVNTKGCEWRPTERRMLELTPELTVSRIQSVSPYKDPALRKRAAEIYRAAGVPG